MDFGVRNSLQALIVTMHVGMSAIKLYAWEGPYVQRITELRNAEIKQIRRGIFHVLPCISQSLRVSVHPNDFA